MKPSDDLILNMTVAEMAWIQAMVMQDFKEEYEEKLNFLEYLASFTNPEGVRKIRSERKNAKVLSDDDFGVLVSAISGREAPIFKERE